MPRASQVHIDKALEKISVAFMPMGLVHNELSTTIPVEKESDSYFVYSKDNLRVPETRWADGGTVKRSIWNLSTASYNAERHGLDDLVTDRTRDNADKAIRPEADLTEGLTGQIMLRKEVDLFTLINTATNWANTTSLSTTQVWSADTTLSNPIIFVHSATTAIRRNSSKIANTIMLPDATFKAAKEHQSIVDRIKHTSAESVTENMLATLFDVSRVLNSKAVQNTGEEGLADTLTDIATDTVFVGYIESSPGLRKPSAFYTFVKNQGGGSTARVRKYRDDPREGTVIEVSTFFQHKIVASDCGYLIINTI